MGSIFTGCSRLTDVIIGDNVKFIPELVFSNCSELTSVTIPDSVTSIGEYAFWGCSRLTSIIIPDNVTSIGDGVFGDCSILKTVYWNASKCTSGGSGSYPTGSDNYPIFANCTKLTKVIIGDDVEYIPAYAFYGCTKLTSITIPNSVTSIGYYAFYGCSGLTSVTFEDTDGWHVDVTYPQKNAEILRQGTAIKKQNKKEIHYEKKKGKTTGRKTRQDTYQD